MSRRIGKVLRRIARKAIRRVARKRALRRKFAKAHRVKKINYARPTVGGIMLT